MGGKTSEVAGNGEGEVLLVVFLWVTFCNRLRRVRRRGKRRLAFARIRRRL